MKRVIINAATKHLVDTEQDFHCADGLIQKKHLTQKAGTTVTTNKGISFTLLDASFSDYYERLERNAQLITPKDIGAIVAYTGIDKKSVVVDAGAGSGGLCLFLAHLVKKVVAYEINASHLATVERNKKKLGLTNITLKTGDITQPITEKNVDLCTLDIKEPWCALSTAHQALKPGGFLVVYCPHITQVQETIRHASSFVVIKTIELLERPWVVDDKRARPEFQILGHTGFLLFLRKI